jgi:hypothetical protein
LKDDDIVGINANFTHSRRIASDFALLRNGSIRRCWWCSAVPKRPRIPTGRSSPNVGRSLPRQGWSSPRLGRRLPREGWASGSLGGHLPTLGGCFPGRDGHRQAWASAPKAWKSPPKLISALPHGADRSIAGRRRGVRGGGLRSRRGGGPPPAG